MKVGPITHLKVPFLFQSHSNVLEDLTYFLSVYAGTKKNLHPRRKYILSLLSVLVHKGWCVYTKTIYFIPQGKIYSKMSSRRKLIENRPGLLYKKVMWLPAATGAKVPRFKMVNDKCM